MWFRSMRMARRVPRAGVCAVVGGQKQWDDMKDNDRMMDGEMRFDDTPADFFAELETVASMATADVARGYDALGVVFHRVVDQALARNDVAFAGLFAKVDYLLKEHSADPVLSRRVNATRDRLRHRHDLPQTVLRRHFPYDLKNVCRFVTLVCGRAPLPPTLASALPAADIEDNVGELLSPCLRVIVDRVEDTIADVTTERGAALRVDFSGPWADVCPLLSPGSQLNLVRPRMEAGLVRPELAIFEPDYLVDISAIAACFEHYGCSPFTYLLNKIKPAPQSAHILLGNFSGLMLDEAVHGRERPYADSVADFFRHNAIAIAACEDLDASFHREATAQRANIWRSLRSVLPAEVAAYDHSEAMLEPSFFCEALGVQGRMDFLQLGDGRRGQCVLMEQKSGKGAFPPGPNPDTPRLQEKHYVQLLLYMAVLRYGCGIANADIQAFLLYSRYANSLVKVGPAPDLLRRAIMLRNRIVRCELWYAGGGISVLERLTPDSLNDNHVSGRLWQQYTRPQIESLLLPVRRATPLERAYYFRFMTFLEREHLLSKVGNKTKENSGFAAKWHDTLDEKLRAGNIYCALAIVALRPDPETGIGVAAVELAFGNGVNAEAANFRPGDIVVLYSYRRGLEPDVRRGPAMRATITAITTARLVLSLRSPQTDARVFNRPQDHCWAVEHDLFETSFTALYRAMHAFLSAPAPRRDLILCRRRPDVGAPASLRRDSGAFNDLVRRAMQARDFFIVIGPPGTGKTSFAMLNILREELSDSASSVLLMAYTNRAVDEMCSKLSESGIDFVRMGSSAACAEPFRDHLLERRAASCANVGEVRRLIVGTRVFCATTSALNANPALLAMRDFSLAIVDEASQILEPHIVGLLSATAGGMVSIRRFVLIGDHKQLPAVVQQTPAESRVADPQLQAIGLSDCRDSLFERMLRAYRDDPSVVYMLTRQGRMHRDIAAFPSRAFYAGRLSVVPLAHQERSLPPHVACDDVARRMVEDCRVAFGSVQPGGDDASDKVNTTEARVIAEVVNAVRRLHPDDFDPAVTVGVIVPYRNQIAAVREAMARCGGDGLERVTIDTVERYQGSQRDVIVYGFTVRKRYQLNFLAANVFREDGEPIDRKLNVAMTRAREHLVMVGNAPLLCRNAVFAKLIEELRLSGCYFDCGTECGNRYDG